eukprot:6173364-Pleurochrysis_carterae.AAC.7
MHAAPSCRPIPVIELASGRGSLQTHAPFAFVTTHAKSDDFCDGRRSASVAFVVASVCSWTSWTSSQLACFACTRVEASRSCLRARVRK